MAPRDTAQSARVRRRARRDHREPRRMVRPRSGEETHGFRPAVIRTRAQRAARGGGRARQAAGRSRFRPRLHRPYGHRPLQRRQGLARRQDHRPQADHARSGRGRAALRPGDLRGPEGLSPRRRHAWRCSGPDANARRFNQSAERLAMPKLPEETFLEVDPPARARRPRLVPDGRRRLALHPPVHVRQRGVPRRQAVVGIPLPRHRLAGRRLLQERRARRFAVDLAELHARRARRHRRRQVRRQLRLEPRRPGRSQQARLRPGRVPRCRRAQVGRGTRRHERVLRVRRRLAADAAAVRHDPARHHARQPDDARPRRRPDRARGALFDRPVARGRRERQADRGVRLRHRRRRHADRHASKSPDGEFKIGAGGPGQTTMRIKQRLVDIQRGAAPDPHGWVRRID